MPATLGSAPSTPYFLTDPKVRAVYDSFGPGREVGILQLTADEGTREAGHVRFGGRGYADFSTCSYLNLERHPRVVEGIRDAASCYGASFIVSRAFASTPLIGVLEDRLSEVFGHPSLVTPSTTLGHFSFLATMVQPGDAVLLDAQVHNSVRMAAQRVAHKAEIKTVPHNDLEAIEQAVVRLVRKAPARRVWYAGDGIYSMYGDLAPMDGLLDLLDRYDAFHVYLDDAHGMSVRGRHGRGYVLSEAGTLHPRMAIAVSLSKAFGAGCGGALVLPDEAARDVVRACGPTMMFSSPMPPPMLGGAVASADLHLSGEVAVLQRALDERIAAFQTAAAALELDVPSSPLSPVQYVFVGANGDAARVVRHLFDAGFWVNICSYPAVPKDKSGVRVTLHAGDPLETVEALALAIRQAVDEAGP